METILDLRSSDKYVALQSLFIYYTWKNIRNQYKNKSLKIILNNLKSFEYFEYNNNNNLNLLRSIELITDQS